jgi:hypothetical protein
LSTRAHLAVRSRKRQPEPELTWYRAAARFGCQLAFLALPILWLHQSRTDAVAPGAAPDRDAPLVDALQAVHDAVDPDLSARLVPSAGLAPRLAGLLAQGTSPLMGEAICLAGTLDDAELLAPLRQLAEHGPSHLRPAAFLAADHFVPWSDAELVDHLGSPVAEVVLAAIRIAAARPVRPVAQLLSLLEHEDPAVREAALAALPVPLSDRLVDGGLARARELANPSPQLLLALGRGTSRFDVEAHLLTLLDSPDSRLRMAALDALANKRGVLIEPERIVAFVRDAGRPVIERAAAIWCCERTGTLDRLEEMLDAGPGDALLDYALGRCHLCTLDVRAFARLLRVLEAESSQAPEAVLRKAQQDVRDLLGRQSGEDADVPIARLRDWVAEAPQIVPQPLSPSALARLVHSGGQ